MIEPLVSKQIKSKVIPQIDIVGENALINQRNSRNALSVKPQAKKCYP